MIPASGKMVVLDVDLPVKVAFRALIENQIKSAPLWDSSTRDYAGMITVTDFIDILRHFYLTRDQDPPNHHSLFSQEEYQIKTWRGEKSQKQTKSKVQIFLDLDLEFCFSHSITNSAYFSFDSSRCQYLRSIARITKSPHSQNSNLGQGRKQHHSSSFESSTDFSIFNL
jgi:hypothetical protein